MAKAKSASESGSNLKARIKILNSTLELTTVLQCKLREDCSLNHGDNYLFYLAHRNYEH